MYDAEYLQGFISKCAEHGVDPEALVKQAKLGKVTPVLKRLMQLLSGSKAKQLNRNFKNLKSVSDAAKHPLSGGWTTQMGPFGVSGKMLGKSTYVPNSGVSRIKRIFEPMANQYQGITDVAGRELTRETGKTQLARLLTGAGAAGVGAGAAGLSHAKRKSKQKQD